MRPLDDSEEIGSNVPFWHFPILNLLREATDSGLEDEEEQDDGQEDDDNDNQTQEETEVVV